MTGPALDHQQAIRENVAQIRQRIAAACARAGRAAAEVTLVAVSKTVESARIRAALAAGIRVLGENRVQEAQSKLEELRTLSVEQQVQWHLIGHLQSNKARRAVELFDAVHSVDSLKLAEKLAQAAAELGKRLPVFLEVNLGGEDSKAGLAPAAVSPLCEAVSKLDALELKGLMAVPPFLDDVEAVRPFFRRLRELRDAAVQAGVVGPAFRELSMGMSNDFEVAIEEGATFVRVGTALFGARQYV
ncbi:MAG: YggS family pyridoxal phosphate-dependent enzyme [Acidobacteria bacterium]|nr:YggS family pyridoxal phosphate-dependent enzyme [Acidobacteriota bacterium]MBI3424588.1 YggS family pyridoxal phosphate-dependent enzyme [Acidobacteriota bacterium]